MKIHVVSVPYDSGMHAERAGAGPQRLLDSGLVERLEKQGHAVTGEEIELPSAAPASEIATAFALNALLSDRVRSAREGGALPIVLAGNCNAAIGSVAGIERRPTGVLWFDAHGDFNTPETTVGGFLDGMALATVTGRCWRQLVARVPGFQPVEERDVLLLAARDLDPLEAEALADSGVDLIPTENLRAGIESLLERLADRVESCYLHLDLDLLDAAEGRANSLAAPGGPSTAEMMRTLEAIGTHLHIGAVTLASYDPSCDEDGVVGRAAVEMLAALLKTLELGVGPRHGP
jgi:arginase